MPPAPVPARVKPTNGKAALLRHERSYDHTAYKDTKDKGISRKELGTAQNNF